MKFLINKNDAHRKPVDRAEVEAEVVREVHNCLWIRLSNGDTIRRKKNRDLAK